MATLVPPLEKVPLRTLTTADGKAYVGVEMEYRDTTGELTLLQVGLSPEDAVDLAAHLAQLGEKLQSSEHWAFRLAKRIIPKPKQVRVARTASGKIGDYVREASRLRDQATDIWVMDTLSNTARTQVQNQKN